MRARILKSPTAAGPLLPLNIQALLGDGEVNQVAKPRPPLLVTVETFKEGRAALECLGYMRRARVREMVPAE
jgi:hypothetical protein